MTQQEIDALGHSIAYDAACTVIESSCPAEIDDPVGLWFNTARRAIDQEARDGVRDSVRYLEARGLIVRRPDNSKWIALRDENEAKIGDLYTSLPCLG